MSKKRFVEFYLAAMMRSAASERVKLSYSYSDQTREEIVHVEYIRDNGATAYEIPVTKLDLLEIAATVIEKVRGMQK